MKTKAILGLYLAVILSISIFVSYVGNIIIDKTGFVPFIERTKNIEKKLDEILEELK